MSNGFVALFVEASDHRRHLDLQSGQFIGEFGIIGVHGRQQGEQCHIRRSVRIGPDAHRVEALQVLLPQGRDATPGGDERAAAERGGAEQRPLRDQGDHGEGQEEQHPGAGQQALRQAGVDQERVVVGRVVGGVMAAHRLGGQRLGQRARRVFREHAERPARRQLGAQAAERLLAPPCPDSPGSHQPQRVGGHRGVGGQLIHGGRDASVRTPARVPASRAVRGYSGLTLWLGLAFDRMASILSAGASLKTCPSSARAIRTGRLSGGTMPVVGKALTDEIMSVGKVTPSAKTAGGPAG